MPDNTVAPPSLPCAVGGTRNLQITILLPISIMVANRPELTETVTMPRLSTTARPASSLLLRLRRPARTGNGRRKTEVRGGGKGYSRLCQSPL